MWQEALNAELLRRLDALALNLRATSAAGEAGNRRSRAKGSSVEFADFREYQPGDDPRRIDWAAFARFDRLILRLFLDERDTLLTLWIDCSASMGPKADTVRALAAALGYLTLSRFDRLRVCALGQGLKVRSQIFRGRAGFPAVVAFLDALSFDGDTALLQGVRAAPPSPGGVSILLSDLLTGDDWRQSISFLAYCKQQIAVVQTFAPEELDPQLEGPVRLESAEGEPAVEIQADAAVLAAYRAALTAFTTGVREHCHRLGAAWALLDTGVPLQRVLFDTLPAAGILR